MRFKSSIIINDSVISLDEPVYFIADIAANHDGDVSRAKELIWRAKEAGADAVKFQHFLADKIVSDYGFKSLGASSGHQAQWKKSVFDIYRQYECNRNWTDELYSESEKAKIDFFSTPYDMEAVDLLNAIVPAFKIGSGDITWLEFIEFVANKQKPVLLACGAANIFEVERAVNCFGKINDKLVLMQCNTNYTGSAENYSHINLNVLKAFAIHFPGVILGLSDHTYGHAAVLGAIALGARVIEKHFTDDNNRVGPDHYFAMNPSTWKEMVMRSREIESALGDGIKRIESNELETSVIQRRCIRLNRDMVAGEIITRDVIECLRPAPENSLSPHLIGTIIGKAIRTCKACGDAIFVNDLSEVNNVIR